MGENSSWIVTAFVKAGVMAVGVLLLALFNLKKAFDAKADRNKFKMRYSLIPIFCLVAMIISWITNFGLYRFKHIIQALPLIHSLLFLAINAYAVKKVDNSKLLRRMLWSMYITFTAAYFVMPDIAESGIHKVFFGLIKEKPDIIILCNRITPALFTANIVFMTLVVISAFTAKEKFALVKKKKSDYK